MRKYFLPVSILAFFMLAMPIMAQKVYHVNIQSGNDANDGLRWSSAFKNIQPAIDVAEKGDTVKIAQGTYLPTKKIADLYSLKAPYNIPTNDRHRSFLIKNDILLYGGFPANANDATSMNDRDRKKYETILSGDFNSNDGAYDHSDELDYSEPIVNMEENALHVVVMPVATSKVLLDGFTIMGGNAALDSADVYVDNVLIQRNCGGGIYAIAKNESSPTLTNLIIRDNHAAGEGGGFYNYAQSGGASPRLTHVTLIRNFAGEQGGGFYNNGMDAEPILSNVQISCNQAQMEGGGLICIAENTASPILEDVLISGNTGRTGGGASIVSLTENVIPLITNATICNNKATSNNKGGGLVITALTLASNPKIRNSVIWGNKSDKTDNLIVEGRTGENPVFANCLIEGRASEGTNMGGDTDPMFIKPADTDFALTLYDFNNYRLLPESPLINKGNNSFITLKDDLDGKTRICGGVVDIGAYEFQDDDSGNKVISNSNSIWSYRGALYIKIEKNVAPIRIYSENGWLVRQVNNPDEGVYTIPSLPHGLYIVTLSTGETAKILIH